MHQKPAGKLCATDGHFLLPATILVVFIPERYFAVFNRFDAAVGDGHPVGVSSQAPQVPIV